MFEYHKRLMMEYIEKFKKYGLKRIFLEIYNNKIDLFERMVFLFVFKKKKLNNYIIIESHNDFDCNGGAFYSYLIKNKLNEKYKIIWLLKNKCNKKKLPKNVSCFKMFTPSLRKNYYIVRAKFLLADNYVTKKVRKDQVSIYLTHGGVTFKNVQGIVVVPEHVDYILSPSKNYDEIMCKNYSIPYPNSRMLHVGMPKNDCLFEKNEKEIKKITNLNYEKTILWMPTFRKMNADNRNDSLREYKYGVPLFNTIGEWNYINDVLKIYNVLLVLKLHPAQDLFGVKNIPKMSNVEILDEERTKKAGINIYSLMANCDAMLSDYSSSPYSFLLLNRQLGFILEDIKDYRLGFNISDYNSVLPGSIINSIYDMEKFIVDVSKNNDLYMKERQNLLDWLYEYKDGKSCLRLAKFLGIE